MWAYKRFWLALVMGLCFLALSSCAGTRALMQTASYTPKQKQAVPKIEARNRQSWESQKPHIRSLFEQNIYGQFPKSLTLSAPIITTLPGTHFNGTAKISSQAYSITNPNTSQSREFTLVLVEPTQTDGPLPIILMQNFCPNHDVIAVPGISVPKEDYFSCSGDGMLNNAFTYMFGRYIVSPPVEMIMQKGYALAVMNPSEFVPDDTERGYKVLNKLFGNQNEETRTGAIMAWARQFSLVSEALKSNPRFSSTVTMGHSRFGKSSLLAAAFDNNIDAILSHQSGTGGASLSRNKPGETVAAITQNYPFWFAKAFQTYAGNEESLPVDQHMLLALIAPRPVLLGNSKRDVWSDPNGAFIAAQAASTVYELYGNAGLTVDRLDEFAPDASLSYWIRPGTHGIVKEDWPAFLEFLDAHIK